MPIYIKDDSPYYWADYRDAQGRRIRRSTGISKTGRKEAREAAEALLGKWKAEVHAEKMWGKAPEQAAPIYTFGDVMMRYAESAGNGNKDKLNRIKVAAKPMYSMFKGLPIADLDIKGYIQYRQAGGVSAGTINRELGVLSAACNYVRDELGWDVPNPAAKRKLPEPEGRVRWITREEAGRLIQSAAQSQAPHLVDFIVLALNTGMRSGEILGLEWNRVDLRANLITLESQHTKARKRRSVPLNASAREAILSRARFRAENCPDSRWVFAQMDGRRVDRVRQAFQIAAKRAGITDIHPHDLRHTCASWLVMDGVPIIEVRDVLGHATTHMTERYAHLAPENIRAAVARIQGVNRSAGHDLVTDNIEPKSKAV